MSGVDWHLKITEIVSCNCAYGCPCQFNALPTYGDCRAAAGYRIDEGHWGETDMAGVKFVGLWAWPGAIHEGGGEAQLVIDENASEDQRKAVEALFNGEETEPGAIIFNVFTNVVDTYHDPIVKPIEIEVNPEGREGSLHVPGIIDTRMEPIRNPVTDNIHRAQVTLPHGFEYHTAEYASGTTQTGSDSTIELKFEKSHAHVARLDWTGQGPAHA
ncbi:MAG: DUF1326 domain-containing protein [Rhodovibrionaceae bacterium]|nr:DUF1326 domain-containing protein [Rhodovibrionaceae bacterium]